MLANLIKTSSDTGGFGFSLAAQKNGFYVGAPFANNIKAYTWDTTSKKFKSGSIIKQTDGEEAAYYGYSIASIASASDSDSDKYVTDPKQIDVLNKNGSKSDFMHRIEAQHNSILTVCDTPNTGEMICEVKVKEPDIANKAGYADFITASSMQGKDVFVVDTQDKLYISHDLTQNSYLIEDGILKTISCNTSCEANNYDKAPIAFEDIDGTDEHGTVYNYSYILFGYEEEQLDNIDVSDKNLYTGSYKEYDGKLYKKHLLAFTADGKYPDDADGPPYFGNKPENASEVEKSSLLHPQQKLYRSDTAPYTNSQFTWTENADLTNVTDADQDKYYRIMYGSNFLFCKDTTTSATQCADGNNEHKNLYVARKSQDQYFLFYNNAKAEDNEKAETTAYKVKAGNNLAEPYEVGYMICYDGYSNDYNADTAIYNSGSMYIYACQAELPTKTLLATNKRWPKYELYADHTLYENGQLTPTPKKSAPQHIWCGINKDNQFACKTAEGRGGRKNSEEGYMQFKRGTSKQIYTNGVTKFWGKPQRAKYDQWQMVQWMEE